MKINESQSTVLQHARGNAAQKGAEGNEFQKVMEQVISGADQKVEAPRAGNLGPAADGIQIHYGASGVGDVTAAVQSKQVVEELQQTLDLIDLYAGRLADSSQSISRISPLISHLEERMDNLRHMESDPGFPGKLKPIVTDVVMTIGTEIAKFKRGDYA